MKSLLVLMLVSSAALADDGAMRRCRQLSDAPARLSCYDAISLGVPASASTATATAAPAATAAAPLSSAAPVAAAVSTRARLEQDFGKEQMSSPDRIDRIETTVSGEFEGWVPNQRIRLANGQVWKISDDSSEEIFTVLKNPKVVIARGALGAIFMDIDGARTAPKVKRVK
jgi:hypothetical protein